jgi:hypothetical protein
MPGPAKTESEYELIIPEEFNKLLLPSDPCATRFSRMNLTATLTTTKCKNCGADLVQTYCPACGQPKTDGERLTFRKVWQDFLQTQLGAERGYLFTAYQLVRQPGATIRMYIAGRRKPYTKPFQFYAIALTLLLLLSALMGVDPMQSGRTMNNEMGLNEFKNEQTRASVEKLYALLGSNVKIIYTLCIPLMALAFRLVYRKSGYNFTEFLIFSLYVYGLSILIMLPGPLLYSFDSSGRLYAYYSYFTILASTLYLIWVTYRFFDKRGILGVVRATWAYLLVMIFYGLLFAMIGFAHAILTLRG